MSKNLVIVHMTMTFALIIILRSIGLSVNTRLVIYFIFNIVTYIAFSNAHFTNYYHDKRDLL